jgi:outer membrane protein OmpA-like peptidoglycan-associated protein
MAPSRKNSHQSSLFKKLAYTVLALGLLGLAGMGIKSLLIPISLLDSVTPPAASTLPKLPPLPEFPLVYKHNDPDEITPESVVPSDKANRPIQAVAAPVVQPTPVAQASPVVAAATPVLAPAAAVPVPSSTQALAAPANAQLAAQPAPEVAAQSSVIAPPAVDKGLEAINRIRPGLDQLPGCIVYSSKNEIRIMFQEGIFPDGGLKIGKTGRSQLSQVADYLAKNAPDFWLIIEGQTNTQPTRSSDNYTLGLSRAVAATEVVRTSAKFPTERLMASSAGGSQPPFAVSIPGAEKKNRTVLFRLVPKSGDMPASQP